MSEYGYPDVGPECCVDGCDHQIAGLAHGYEAPAREGVACNDCWDFHNDHGHWPDDDPASCPTCLRAADEVDR